MSFLNTSGNLLGTSGQIWLKKKSTSRFNLGRFRIFFKQSGIIRNVWEPIVTFSAFSSCRTAFSPCRTACSSCRTAFSSCCTAFSSCRTSFSSCHTAFFSCHTEFSSCHTAFSSCPTAFCAYLYLLRQCSL